jgi:PhzF family phenazine biosynthesis protein
LGYLLAMTELRLRTVDAFTDQPFSGNPAAVVVLDEAPPDEWMAALAREMNLSETAFVIRAALPDADFRLRWFTPTTEVDLCGHATLASGHCLLEDGVTSPIRFATRSGVLTVTRQPDGSLAMDFPAAPAVQVDAVAEVAGALGTRVKWTGRSRGGVDFLVALLDDEVTVRELRPDLARVAGVDASGVIVTAAADLGREYAFVSRVFAPRAGIPEDPVTGSSHAVLGPFWAERLGRTSLVGMQVSSRSGLVGVELRGDRVAISGRAVTVLDGIVRSNANHVDWIQSAPRSR